MTTIADSLRKAARELKSVADEPQREAEILLCAVLETDRAHLFTYSDRPLDDVAQNLLNHYVERRKEGEPVAYILGQREFWTLRLDVNDSTLIPRPDTELLVEVALERCDNDRAFVLDLGTGTGAVALALAKERPLWTVDGVDLSQAAVDLAKLNAKHNLIYNTYHYQSHWFSAVRANTKAPNARFDVIVSNPPYIASDDPHLRQGDLRFEPLSALVAENNGLADLFAIALGAREFLKPNGWLMLEHGWQQGEAVRNELAELGYLQIETLKDYGGNERVTIGRQPEVVR